MINDVFRYLHNQLKLTEGEIERFLSFYRDTFHHATTTQTPYDK